MMAAIPLMVIGVMPGFWLLNQLGSHVVGGFRDPVFFSGPAIIGMIALAGIVTRNSIIIVDFVQLGLLRGLALERAVLESVSVRLRPILLTSGAAVLGACRSHSTRSSAAWRGRSSSASSSRRSSPCSSFP